MTLNLKWLTAALVALSMALTGCALQPPAEAAAELAKPALPDRALQDRLLALDPTHITDEDVRLVLAKGPTPRMILIHGGVYPVHLLMES
ncbi:MAG: hypothetical protein ACHP7B_05730, partial [Burkholderiales bacterium]